MELKDPVGFSGETWPQYAEEVERFIALLVEEGARSFLEVGCRYGDTLHAVGCALPEGSTLVGVDFGKSFVHPPGKRKHREPSEFKRGRLDRAVADLRARGQQVHVIIGDSGDPEVAEKVGRFGRFDALFIDAGHSADAVRRDWENYGPMARMVAFHDVCNDGRRLTGPGELFRELGKDLRRVTISVDPFRRGIGVLWRT